MGKLTRDELIVLTSAMVNLLDSWGVSAAYQIALFALPEGTRSGAIRQYRHSTPFPDDVRVMERIEHFIGIADALRTSYPRNAQMGAIWMNRVNHRFDNRTPLAAMLADGLAGVIAVRALLDCAYDWDLSGSGKTS